MVRFERHATTQSYFAQVFLPDPVHNTCVKMTEGPGKGGAFVFSLGRARMKRGQFIVVRH